MAQWLKVCPVSELVPGGRKVVGSGPDAVLVLKTEEGLFACSARCPHLGMPLEEGEVEGGTIRCRAHGYKMELKTGRCLTEAGMRMPVYPIEVREGWICVCR